MATLSWDLVGGNPAPGDRAVYRELSHDLVATARSADSALRRLDHFSRSCDESVWKGEAADAFREKIRELPPKLQKLHRSYNTASGSMAGYGAVLDELQPRARTLLERAHAARREEFVQKANRDRARAQAPDSGLLSFVSTPATPFDQAVEDAQNQQQEIKRQIDRLRDDRRGAERKAVAGLERAQNQGIQADSWMEKRLQGIDKWVDKHADVLRKISGALKIVSAVAGVLSFIPVLNFITAPIALATGGAALAIDGTLVATGNGNWKVLAVDAALMALPGVGKLVGKGLRSGAPQLMGRVEGAVAGSRAMAAVNRVGATKAGRILAAPGRGLNRVNDVIAEGLGRTAVGRGIVNASERAAARAGRHLEIDELIRNPKPKGNYGHLPQTTEASVADKLEEYLLNPDHHLGKEKARWFKEALGFTRENAADLAKQIKFDHARAIPTELTAHGQKFEQLISIVGAQGRQIDVRFAWIRNNDGIVRLITAIPAKK